MAYLYNILSCDTQEVSIGYSNSNGSVIVGRVYNVDGTCWEVTAIYGEGNILSGYIPLENVPSYISCYNCTFNIPDSGPPSGGGGGGGGQPTTAYNYLIINCETGGVVGNAFHNTNSGLNNRGIVLGPGNVCRRLQYLNQGNPSQNSTNITNIPTTDNACPCTNNPPSGGGGGQPVLQTWYYKLKACSQLNNPNAPIIYANRQSGFADLENGTSVKPGNVCFSVIENVPFPPNPGIYSLSLTNAQLFGNCAQCNVLPPEPYRIVYGIKNCQNPTQTGTAYRIPASTETPNSQMSLSTGQVYKIDNVCWEVTSAEWVQGGSITGFNVTDLSTFITCNACIGITYWEYDVIKCADNTTSGKVWATQDYNFNVSFILDNSCYRIYAKQQKVGNPTTAIGPNITNFPKFEQCACSTVGFDTPNGTPLQKAWRCVNNQCQEYFYDPQTGEEPEFTSLAECIQSGCELPTWYQHTIQRCTAPTTTQIVWATENYNLNTSILLNGTCHKIIASVQNRSAFPTNLTNITNYTKYGQCGCPIGPTINTAKGWQCQQGQCVEVSYNPDEYTLDDLGLFATKGQCEQSSCGKTEYFEAQLTNCKNPNDFILGKSTVLKALGTTYTFTSTQGPRCYYINVISSTFTPIEDLQGTLLDGQQIIAGCQDCPTDQADPCIDTPCLQGCPQNCEKCPQDPRCKPEDPCFGLPPCSPNCPLDCTQCPDDPRCRVKNPCEDVPEPIQGAVLKEMWSGEPYFQDNSNYNFNWLINDCWNHKYCACRIQPDPLDPYTHQWVVCLCGDQTIPCPEAGTFIKYECRNSNDPSSKNKYEKWAVYHNGNCGTYDTLIEINSIFCGYPSIPGCTKAGTMIRTYCVGRDKYAEYHDGKCGNYIERIEVNSKTCGYVDPPPPPPPPPPKVDNEPPVVARVYYPIDISNTLHTKDITSFPLWTDETPFLLTPSTQSLSDSSSLNYILPVYHRSPDNKPTCSAELQYNIIYADYEGKGARDLGGYDEQTLSKAMYTQYANVLLPHGQRKFNFSGEDEDYVYIIDLARRRFKQSLDPGNWEITIASCSFSNDIEVNSILPDMHTASFAGSTITLVDIMTKRPEQEAPVYLSSKPYDIVIGTIEDGTGTNYVTASYISISSSLSPSGSQPEPIIKYINTSIQPNNSTVTVQGARVYYWGTDGTVTYRLNGPTGSLVDITPSKSLKNVNPVATLVSSSYTMSLKEIETTYGVYLAKYEGGWTGSFLLPGSATLAPTIMSGSCYTEIYYNGDFQISQATAEQQVLEGYTFPQRTRDLSQVPVKQTLTVNGVTYTGNLKWRTPPLLLEYLFSGSVAYNTPIISGSYQPDVNLAFLTDEWGLQDFVEDPTNPKDEQSLVDGTYFNDYKDLDNGFILIPIRKTSYGRVYPSHGIIVLSGKKLDGLGFNTNRSVDNHGYNTYRLYHAMKVVLDKGLTDLSGDQLAFYGRGVDIIKSSRYFVTLYNSHLNYSNNPTYVTGSEGEIIDGFLYQNKAYFSSIGLYNSNRDLLAIGKISKPIMSSLTDEMLFTVKITQ